MTTQQAAAQYLYEHLRQISEENEVFNPSNLPIEQLPIIYGFNNGGSHSFLDAAAIAEDGTYLGGHICSDEGYMRHDLGIAKGSRRDRHEESYQKHYPNGYLMEFVGYSAVPTHEKLNKALKLNTEKQTEKQNENSA